MVLIDRHLAGDAVGRATARKDDRRDASLPHRLDETERTADIVPVIEVRIDHRLANIGERRHVDNASGPVAPDYLGEMDGVSDVAHYARSKTHSGAIAAG